MIELLARLPEERDPNTDLGCYMQVTTTYSTDGSAFVDYNCAYDSEWYRQRQRLLAQQVAEVCPQGVRHYVNTPSVFYGARDYWPNYDELAKIKDVWDPHEVMRVYQGVRPSWKEPDAYEFARPYIRQTSRAERLGQLGWDLIKRWLL